MVFTIAGLASASVAAAQAPGPTLDPASPQARQISDLFVILLAVSGLVLLLVWGLLLYCIVRFRARPGAGVPRQVQGNTPLEIGWTVAPALVLAVVAVLQVPAVFAPVRPLEGALTVVATGNQYWWEFEYPELGVLTANEMQMPVGVPIKLQLQAGDVIHSFWIPRLNGKTDLVPGRTNEMWLYTDQPDTYVGQCAELCGLQHAWMLLRVIAVPRADFEAWVAAQRAPATAPDSGLARRGQEVYQANACGNCHAIRGTSATARVAPDLTHLASRQTLGAGVLTNTPDNLRRWVDDPQAFKPGALMPTFRLAEADLAALTAYLEALK